MISHFELFSVLHEGTPLAVFNRGQTLGSVSSVRGDCTAPSDASFNPSSGEIQVSYDIGTFNADQNCSLAAPPNLFGYSSAMPSNSLTIGLDIRTLVTCIALNSGFAYPDNMQITTTSEYMYKNTVYPTVYYTDSRYPGMKPVLCIFLHGIKGRPSCTIIVGSVYAVPVFAHAGQNRTYPVQCNCSDLPDVPPMSPDYCKSFLLTKRITCHYVVRALFFHMVLTFFCP